MTKHVHAYQIGKTKLFKIFYNDLAVNPMIPGFYHLSKIGKGFLEVSVY